MAFALEGSFEIKVALRIGERAESVTVRFSGTEDQAAEEGRKVAAKLWKDLLEQQKPC